MEIAGFCEPARGVGGDYYDFIILITASLVWRLPTWPGKECPPLC